MNLWSLAGARLKTREPVSSSFFSFLAEGDEWKDVFKAFWKQQLFLPAGIISGGREGKIAKSV
jgi:hypothetical protein